MRPPAPAREITIKALVAWAKENSHRWPDKVPGEKTFAKALKDAYPGRPITRDRAEAVFVKMWGKQKPGPRSERSRTIRSSSI
jgi:hypothetical protein